MFKGSFLKLNILHMKSLFNGTCMFSYKENNALLLNLFFIGNYDCNYEHLAIDASMKCSLLLFLHGLPLSVTWQPYVKEPVTWKKSLKIEFMKFVFSNWYSFTIKIDNRLSVICTLEFQTYLLAKCILVYISDVRTRVT